jgi:hypothetical protein
VAYDFSDAADSGLKYAVMLASKPSRILFGLHRIGNDTVNCSDGVVSATIREAHCPVMTVPSSFSC